MQGTSDITIEPEDGSIIYRLTLILGIYALEVGIEGNFGNECIFNFAGVRVHMGTEVRNAAVCIEWIMNAISRRCSLMSQMRDLPLFFKDNIPNNIRPTALVCS